MKITDLLTLTAFFESVALGNPDLHYFLPLSNAEKAVDEISAYYTNDYAGTTVFFQVADIVPKDQLITFLCSLTIASKPDGAGARAGLVARDLTLKLLLDFLGRLRLASDEAIQQVEEQGDMYDLCIEVAERIFPIGMLANVNLEGHYIDIDVTVPATHLMYPA